MSHDDVVIYYRAIKHVCLFVFSPASKHIKMFVLDEADEMLSRGFKDQIYEIFQKLASSTQVRARHLDVKSFSGHAGFLTTCRSVLVTGCPSVGHHASRRVGGHKEVHA